MLQWVSESELHPRGVMQWGCRGLTDRVGSGVGPDGRSRRTSFPQPSVVTNIPIER